MGDKGHFYAGFTEDFAWKWKTLFKSRRNRTYLTEAAQLLDEDYIDGGYNEEYIKICLYVFQISVQKLSFLQV